MSKRIAIIFSVCDSDRMHFDRFYMELQRLQIPYAVNYDHCDTITKRLFSYGDLFLGAYHNDNPKDFFDETHRQRALDIVNKHGFDWVLQMDVDETLEPDALVRIYQALGYAEKNGYDVLDCPLLDLWEDNKHYRVDGPFARSHREKMFFLKSRAGKFEYYHPTSHAPKILKSTYECKLIRTTMLYVIHHGIMNKADVEFHTKRWDEIYTRKVGGNPYGFYPYINDPNTVPILKSVEEALVKRNRL